MGADPVGHGLAEPRLGECVIRRPHDRHEDLGGVDLPGGPSNTGMVSPAKSTNSFSIAKLLEVSDRSLRRQLRKQGISFRGLLDELRMQIALKYLRTTRLANEDIAMALGFSDAANFRRAFRRWTNESPHEIRTE
jgi:AraC-like DNA-binding protein